MGINTLALGWAYSFGATLHDEHIRKVDGYKKDKLIAILSQLCRVELGGSYDSLVTLKQANKVVGRFIHISDVAIRLDGFNAWKQLKYRLNSQKELWEERKFGDLKPISHGSMDWKYGQRIRRNDELRLESERLLAYMYEGERIEAPIDRVQRVNKYVMYYDASLVTSGCWFAHPDLNVVYAMDTSIAFRGFHISALELITMIWGLLILAKWARSMGKRGPLLLVAYGDNSSVPLVVHKTFARSFGMDF